MSDALLKWEAARNNPISEQSAILAVTNDENRDLRDVFLQKVSPLRHRAIIQLIYLIPSR
jgi:hypothetical protein